MIFIEMNTCLIVLVMCVICSSQQQCTKLQFSRFENNVQKATTLGDDVRRFPQSNGELRRWCSDTLKHLDNADQFNRECLKGMNRQVVGVGTYAMRKAIKRLCKQNSQIGVNFIDGGQCFNMNKVTVNKCYFAFRDEIAGAKYDPDDKKKLPHICCGLHRVIHCFDETLITKKGCNQKRINIITNYLDSLALNMLDIMCGTYTRDSDQCERLGMPPKVPSNEKLPKTFIIPMLELMQSLPEV